MSKPKFKPGAPIRSLAAFTTIYRFKQPICFRGKVTTFGWYQNWSIRQIDIDIALGYLCRALPIKEGQE